MHELQEEYLVAVKYDVTSFADLIHLKFRLQRVDEELCKAQKEMYKDRTLRKRSCKTVEDLAFFKASENDYRERLEQIKFQKKDNFKKLKAVERCLERDGSMLDAELEYRVLVDDMADVEKDEVPENPYQVQKNSDALVLPADDLQSVTVRLTSELLRDNIQVYEEAKLPSNKADYMRMSLAEKVSCYLFDKQGTEVAFDTVKAYFETIDIDTDFHAVYEETKLLTDYYEKQKAEEFIQKRVEQVIKKWNCWG